MLKMEEKNSDSQKREECLTSQETIINNKKVMIENLNIKIGKLKFFLKEVVLYEANELVLDNSITQEEGEVSYLENTITLFIDMTIECLSQIHEIFSFICESSKEFNKIDEKELASSMESLFNYFVENTKKIDSSCEGLTKSEREFVESMLLTEIESLFSEFNSDFLQKEKLKEFKEKIFLLKRNIINITKEISNKVQKESLSEAVKESIIIQFNFLAETLSLFINKLPPRLNERDAEGEKLKEILFFIKNSLSIVEDVEEIELLQKNSHVKDKILVNQYLKLKSCTEDIKNTLQEISKILQNLPDEKKIACDAVGPLSTNYSVESVKNKRLDAISDNSSTTEHESSIEIEEKITCDEVEVVCYKKEELKKSSTMPMIQASKLDDNALYQDKKDDKVEKINSNFIRNFFIISTVLFATLAFVAKSYDNRNLIYSSLAIIPLLVVALCVISLKIESPKTTLYVTKPIVNAADVCNSATIIK